MLPLLLSFVAGQLLSALMAIPFATVAAVAIAGLVLRTLAPSSGRAVAALVCLLLGAAVVTWRATPPAAGCVLPDPGPSRKTWLEAEIGEAPIRLSDGWRMDVRAVLANGPKREALCGRVRLTIAAPAPALLPGDRIRVHAHLRRPRNFANPGGYDQIGALARRGIWATAFARATTLVVQPGGGAGWRRRIAAERARIGALVDASLPVPDAALMRALVTGDVAGIPDDFYDRVARTGLAHVLSVSGLHVGAVWGAVFLVLCRIGSRSEQLLLRTNVRACAGALAAPAAILYGLLAGGRLPTGRAVLMTSFLTLAVGCGREIRPVRSLVYAAAVLSCLEPGAPLDLSFQLSFVSVLALILGVERWSSRRRADGAGPFRRSWREGLSLAWVVPLAALVGTAPLAAWHFNRVAPVGLLTNPLLVPLVAVPATLLGLAAAAISFVSEPAAGLLFRVAGWPIALFRHGVDLASAVPFGSVRVPTPTLFEILVAYAALALPWHPPRWRRSTAAVLAALLLADGAFWLHERVLDPRLRIRFLDVGQGDSAVVEMPGNEVLVIDGGGFLRSHFDVGERVVARYLLTRRILSVDVLVATHADWDHQGGLHAIAREFAPRELWRSVGPVDRRFDELDRIVRSGGGRVRTLHAGEAAYRKGDVAVECLHPPDADRLSANDSSLVLRVAFGTVSILLTGDVETAGERLLLGSGRLAPVHVLKVPHHGSRTSSTERFVRESDPTLAVFTVGAGNRYGLPHPDVLARYRRAGAQIVRTDVHGSLLVATAGERPLVRPFSRASPAACALAALLC